MTISSWKGVRGNSNIFSAKLEQKCAFSAQARCTPPSCPVCFFSAIFELSATSSSMTNKVTGLKSGAVWCHFSVYQLLTSLNNVETVQWLVNSECEAWHCWLLCLSPLQRVSPDSEVVSTGIQRAAVASYGLVRRPSAGGCSAALSRICPFSLSLS